MVTPFADSRLADELVLFHLNVPLTFGIISFDKKCKAVDLAYPLTFISSILFSLSHQVIPMFPKFPRGVDSSSSLKKFQLLFASVLLKTSRTIEPLRKHRSPM